MKRLKYWYNYESDDQIVYFMYKKLLNKNEVRLEIIRLAANNCCKYVDQNNFSVKSGMQFWW